MIELESICPMVFDEFMEFLTRLGIDPALLNKPFLERCSVTFFFLKDMNSKVDNNCLSSSLSSFHPMMDLDEQEKLICEMIIILERNLRIVSA